MVRGILWQGHLRFRYLDIFALGHLGFRYLDILALQFRNTFGQKIYVWPFQYRLNITLSWLCYGQKFQKPRPTILFRYFCFMFQHFSGQIKHIHIYSFKVAYIYLLYKCIILPTMITIHIFNGVFQVSHRSKTIFKCSANFVHQLQNNKDVVYTDIFTKYLLLYQFIQNMQY